MMTMTDDQIFQLTNGLVRVAKTATEVSIRKVRTKPNAAGKVRTKTVCTEVHTRYVSNPMPCDDINPFWPMESTDIPLATCDKYATDTMMPTALKLRPALAACIMTNQYDSIIKELAYACSVLDNPAACLSTPQRQILAEEITYTIAMLRHVGQFAGSDEAGGMTIEFDATKLAEVTAFLTPLLRARAR